jgi:hypothetical protein
LQNLGAMGMVVGAVLRVGLSVDGSLALTRESATLPSLWKHIRGLGNAAGGASAWAREAFEIRSL